MKKYLAINCFIVNKEVKSSDWLPEIYSSRCANKDSENGRERKRVIPNEDDSTKIKRKQIQTNIPFEKLKILNLLIIAIKIKGV